MDPSSSSRVTVEYHDPAGIFSLLAPHIVSRLPLRNLGWQSPSRPLRQIKSLHLDFVPDSFTQNSLRPPPQNASANATSSFEILRGGLGSGASKERRHQIPGLQTSPYLKIYVLRCDDKDAYKEVERKQVREWIRETAATARKGKGGGHEAFEWMILHVVIPDTVAASEPRWRETSLRDSDELKERPKQGAAWPGKSTRTVFDKLRADFNESSKGSQERVAQIRLLKEQMPADLLPTPAIATTLEETSEERETAWHDLMYKFKTLILRPFDQRVRQYEADIAEQESRRSLPGFNFCTFFMHKEGLAKAFDSIGLVEDALVIYDELYHGMESTLRDMANGDTRGSATTFASHTENIQKRISRMPASRPNSISTVSTISSEDGFMEALDKQYREKIARSEISVFDFSCYVFARQKALLLRLANAKTCREENANGENENNEDLVLLGEICWRAGAFIASNARTLRQDVLTNSDANLSLAEVEGLVSTWVYTAAGQVLDDTSSSVLERTLDGSHRSSLPNSAIPSLKRLDLFSSGANAYPQRTTSLPHGFSRLEETQNPGSYFSASGDNFKSPPSSSGTDGTKPPLAGSVPGIPELATYRADLAVIQRKALEQLAAQHEWYVGWASIRIQESSMVDIDLDARAEADRSSSERVSGMLTPALASILSSKASFQSAYSNLTNLAIRCYATATHVKRADALLGDLAVLMYQQSEYESAIQCLQHVLPLYESDGWDVLYVLALDVLAKSLQAIGKEGSYEYVKTVLRLASRRYSAVRQAEERGSEVIVGAVTVGPDSDLIPRAFETAINASHCLEDVYETKAAQFFSDIRTASQAFPLEDVDGFSLPLRLRHLLDEDVPLDRVSARLVHMHDPHQEILMTSDSLVLEKGMNNINLTTSTVALGPFFVDEVILSAKNIRFVHEFQPKPESEATPLGIKDIEPTPASVVSAHKRPWVFVYPSHNAFDAEVSLAKAIHLDKIRHLEVRIRSGRNDIEKIDLKLKPASAGLRLHLADATCEGAALIRKQSASGQVSIGSLSADSTALVKIPYSQDQVGRECSLRLVAEYHLTNNCFHSFLTSARLRTALPLDVDVNDVFQSDALFSTFTVRTTSATPLIVTHAELQHSTVYAVEAPPRLPLPMTVLQDQPVNLVYKISRKDGNTKKTRKNESALSLGIRYSSLDELILTSLRAALNLALDNTPFVGYSRLLTPLFCRRALRLLSPENLEMSALLGEIPLPAFDDIKWGGMAHALPLEHRQHLLDWLREWHDTNDHITLDIDAPPEAVQRHITIAVDVPTVDTVHSASLSLPSELSFEDKRHPHLDQRKTFTAQLRISHTRRWSSSAVAGSASEAHAFNFVYEIYYDPEIWQVQDRQRQGHFSVRENELKSFEVDLVPLKAGVWALPTVEVQAAGQKEGSTDKGTGCTTFYESGGQVVRVVEESQEKE